MEQPISSDERLELALKAVLEALRAGRAQAPPGLEAQPQLAQILAELGALCELALAMSKGDLSPTLRLKGAMAGSLKALQSNLRHLTWQAQQIAKGDLSQRVDFMGEFSAAFNQMTVALAEARAQLKQRLEEVEARNAELDAFAHTVAHDLKNPLSGIMGYASLLKDGALGPDDVNEASEWLYRSARKMNDIIESLLLLAGVRKQEVEPFPLEMSFIVAEVLHRLDLEIKNSQAEIILPSEWPRALGYAPWVEEIWANYISNAIKYGGQPPRVELGWTEGERRKDEGERLETQQQNDSSFILHPSSFAFWVRDNGPGLSPEEQARLFTPFTRIHKQRAEGHGLGLTIVQRIAEKLGGRAGVTSQVGQGSVFYFTLPAAIESYHRQQFEN